MSMKNIGSIKTKSSLTNVIEGDTQPNAVDLRVAQILKISNKMFEIDEEKKVHRGSTAMTLIQSDDGAYWLLQPGIYEVVMANEIKVSDGEAGFVITRSTLNRNGVHLTTGLYDSGYYGVMAAVMHVTTGPMKIKPGTRIGQYLCFEAETLHSYDGDYGLNSVHDQKYTT
jgi:deoxycytidine triphosphate deaminase